ncbi:metallophosphoesterase [Streptomyces sp. NBC_01619]|uniref:metallophosphoesterase n=1 Tax=Streptomyces sp. NBC_01619 TaxID=2975901 RepID=UPI002259A92A|nr:metallophosphoesterase [Streptomyces sp. NBC_01619]MCX4512782.1 metallophosphoesterase [Streptomyces sp. NBC_01619]
MLVVLLVIAVVVALLVAVHWYVWRRLVRDTTAGPGALRRAGTAAVVLLPVLSVGALASGRAGAPFWLQQALAWPGFLWLATLLYLTLALVVGEAARPLLRRALSRRADARSASGARAAAAGSVTVAVKEGGPQDAEVLEGTGSVAVSVAVATDGGSGAGAAPGQVRATAPADVDADTGTRAVSDATAVSGDPADVRPEATAATASTAGVVPTGGVSRRLFVARVVGGAAGVVAAGTVGYGAYGVLRGPKVKRVTVPLAKLARGMHGYRIAVVSDIHLGPILGRAHAQRIVDTINATQPDLVAIVGDLVDGSVADLGRSAEPLAQLRARDGSYFVTGNHEYFSGADAWVDHVRELGLTPLRNDRVEIAGFDLAGVDDVAGESEGQGPDFARALGDRDRGRAAVLLAHQPVVIHDAVRHGVDLQLSGHTHGGQLWPGNYLAELANPTVAGLEKYGDTQLYVSRGAGAWGPPVRVGAPSDITVVELASRHA